MPSLPSAACMSSTRPRTGSTGVRHMPTIRQSWTAMTGFASPRWAARQISNSSAARAPPSICGYSLNVTSASAFSTIFGVIEQWRSSSPPIIAPGPTIPRTRASRIALAVLIALRGHGAVHGQEHDIDRHRRAEVVQYLVAKTLIDPAHGEARRLGERREAFHDLALALLRGLAPDMQRQAESGGGMPGGVPAEKHGVLEGLHAGRHGREGVGLGPEAGDKDFHGSPKIRSRCRAVRSGGQHADPIMACHNMPRHRLRPAGQAILPGRSSLIAFGASLDRVLDWRLSLPPASPEAVPCRCSRIRRKRAMSRICFTPTPISASTKNRGRWSSSAATASMSGTRAASSISRAWPASGPPRSASSTSASWPPP